MVIILQAPVVQSHVGCVDRVTSDKQETPFRIMYICSQDVYIIPSADIGSSVRSDVRRLTLGAGSFISIQFVFDSFYVG